MLSEEAWGAVSVPVCPKVLSVGEVRAQCTTLKLFHINLGKARLCGLHFMHRHIAMLEQVWVLYLQ